MLTKLICDFRSLTIVLQYKRLVRLQRSKMSADQIRKLDESPVPSDGTVKSWEAE